MEYTSVLNQIPGLNSNPNWIPMQKRTYLPQTTPPCQFTFGSEFYLYTVRVSPGAEALCAWPIRSHAWPSTASLTERALAGIQAPSPSGPALHSTCRAQPWRVAEKASPRGRRAFQLSDHAAAPAAELDLAKERRAS